MSPSPKKVECSFKALHIKFITCLEQIVLRTFSTVAQSVPSTVFSDALIKLLSNILI